MSDLLRGVPTYKPKQNKDITICQWCKKEKVGKAGKYHKWCIDDVRSSQLKDYQRRK